MPEEAYGVGGIKKTQVYVWHKRFSEGRPELWSSLILVRPSFWNAMNEYHINNSQLPHNNDYDHESSAEVTSWTMPTPKTEIYCLILVIIDGKKYIPETF